MTSRSVTQTTLLIFALLLGYSIPSASAQTAILRGTTDAETGDVLPGAKVLDGISAVQRILFLKIWVMMRFSFWEKETTTCKII